MATIDYRAELLQLVKRALSELSEQRQVTLADVIASGRVTREVITGRLEVYSMDGKPFIGYGGIRFERVDNRDDKVNIKVAQDVYKGDELVDKIKEARLEAALTS